MGIEVKTTMGRMPARPINRLEIGRKSGGNRSKIERELEGQNGPAKPAWSSFDDQLRQAIGAWLAARNGRSLRQLAKDAGIAPTTLVGWHAQPGRSLRLDHGEALARAIGLSRLTVSKAKKPRRSKQGAPDDAAQSWDDQLRRAMADRTQYEVAKGSGLPAMTINSWHTRKQPKTSLRVAEAICRYLSYDLLIL